MTNLPSPHVPSPRSAGYSRGRATKQAIVARAAEAFAQDGFAGASMRAIARAAGIDHSTLLHHFGNKTGLLLAVLEWFDAQNTPPHMPVHLTAELLAEELVAVAERNRTTPGLVRLLTVLSAEAGTPEHPARPALQQRHRVLSDIITATVRNQRETGELPDTGLEPDQVAAVIIATWEGLQSYDALHPGKIEVPKLLAHTIRSTFGFDVE